MQRKLLRCKEELEISRSNCNKIAYQYLYNMSDLLKSTASKELWYCLGLRRLMVHCLQTFDGSLLCKFSELLYDTFVDSIANSHKMVFNTIDIFRIFSFLHVWLASPPTPLHYCIDYLM
jgi:hypothetical protein